MGERAPPHTRNSDTDPLSVCESAYFPRLKKFTGGNTPLAGQPVKGKLVPLIYRVSPCADAVRAIYMFVCLLKSCDNELGEVGRCSISHHASRGRYNTD